MKKATYITMVFCLLLSAGCSESEKTQTDQTAITADNLNTIVGMQWILEQMTVEGEPLELTGEKPFMKIAPDGKVTGFASVNRFFGSMQIDEKGKVSWLIPFSSTKMAGPRESMKQENIFFKAMAQTEKLTKSGIRLYFVSADGTTELVFYVPVE